MAALEKHKHLVIETPPDIVEFVSIGSFGAEFRTLPRNRVSHGDLLEKQWKAIWAKHDVDEVTASQITALPAKEGIYVQCFLATSGFYMFLLH